MQIEVPPAVRQVFGLSVVDLGHAVEGARETPWRSDLAGSVLFRWGRTVEIATNGGTGKVRIGDRPFQHIAVDVERSLHEPARATIVCRDLGGAGQYGLNRDFEREGPRTGRNQHDEGKSRAVH